MKRLQDIIKHDKDMFDFLNHRNLADCKNVDYYKGKIDMYKEVLQVLMRDYEKMSPETKYFVDYIFGMKDEDLK